MSHVANGIHTVKVTSTVHLQVGDLVMMSGCCADDGKYLNVWVPSIWPNVERIEIRGSEGAYEQEQRRRSASTTSRDAYAEVHPPSD